MDITQLSGPSKIQPVEIDMDFMDIDGIEARFDSLEEELDDLYRHAPFGLCTLDISGVFLTVNIQVTAWLGYTEKELIGLKRFDELLTLDSKEKYLEFLPTHFNAGFIGDIELELIGRNGSLHHVSTYSNAILNDDGTLSKHRSVLFNIDERKEMEAGLNIAAAAFETQEGSLITDANQIVLRVNKAFSEITGYSSVDVVGKIPHIISSSKHDADFYAAMWVSINSTGKWSGEIWNRRKTGELYPQFLSLTAVKNSAGVLTNYVATLTDITVINAASDKIKNLAFYDELTALPNRRLFYERLKNGMVLSSRTGHHGALMFLDLDYFKTLNDALGHDVGDLLLQQVSERLSACLREGDTVARLGGDEFVILLIGLSTKITEATSQVLAVGEKVNASLNDFYQLDTHQYQITSSIGVTLFLGQELSIEELLKHADIAMYQSKTAGRNTLTFFDVKMQDVITARVNLEREIRQALKEGEFRLVYQVQVDHLSRPIGAEALIRWLHPKRGILMPSVFISVMEESGLIGQIGQWVLETACSKLKIWENNSSTRNLSLSVNVSAKQLHDPNFATDLLAVVQQHNINPRLLKLELTESMLINNIENIISTMDDLKGFGFGFELDDFGTGFSSLQYLKKLPLSMLKIDQSFVQDICIKENDKAIVLTIITMAKTLGFGTIAEGVETKEQQLLLMKLGCRRFQGYLFGKPMSITEFEAALES